MVTPEGVVSRYFFGIDYPPKELQLELERARAGRVGSPIGRLLLLCYDYDAATGKYTLSILRLIRVLGTATAVSLAGFLFVMIRREGKRPHELSRCERTPASLEATDFTGTRQCRSELFRGRNACGTSRYFPIKRRAWRGRSTSFTCSSSASPASSRC